LATVGNIGDTPHGRIAIGDPAPVFVLPDDSGTQWSSLDNDISGRPLLLVFGGGPSFPDTIAAFAAAEPELARLGCTLFAVTRGYDPAEIPVARLIDADGAVFRAFGIGPAGGAVVISPNARVTYAGPSVDTAVILDHVRRMSSLHWADVVAAHPPVLMVPMALGGDDCARLVRHWHELDVRHGGAGHSDVHPGCVTFIRDYGRVQQYHIDDAAILGALDSKLAPRLLPEIAKAFDGRMTSREALALSRYDAADGGMLRPHRDCAAAETAHRRFSVTIPLNDDFVGGEMRFREYGERLYRPPVGTALVFACALMHEVLAVTSGSRFALVTHLW
jgi:hypothetical protein